MNEPKRVCENKKKTKKGKQGEISGATKTNTKARREKVDIPRLFDTRRVAQSARVTFFFCEKGTRHRLVKMCTQGNNRPAQETTPWMTGKMVNLQPLSIYSTGIRQQVRLFLCRCDDSMCTSNTPCSWGALKGFATNLLLKRTTFFRVQFNAHACWIFAERTGARSCHQIFFWLLSLETVDSVLCRRSFRLFCELIEAITSIRTIPASRQHPSLMWQTSPLCVNRQVFADIG